MGQLLLLAGFLHALKRLRLFQKALVVQRLVALGLAAGQLRRLAGSAAVAVALAKLLWQALAALLYLGGDQLVASRLLNPRSLPKAIGDRPKHSWYKEWPLCS